MRRKEWSDKFDQFIYENFFDSYYGLDDMGIEAYEEWRNNMNDDDYLELVGKFCVKQFNNKEK